VDPERAEADKGTSSKALSKKGFATRGHCQGLDSPKTPRSAGPGSHSVDSYVRVSILVFAHAPPQSPGPPLCHDEAMSCPVPPVPSRPARPVSSRPVPAGSAPVPQRSPESRGPIPGLDHPELPFELFHRPNSQSPTGKGGWQPPHPSPPIAPTGLDCTYPLITHCIPPIQAGGNARNPCHLTGSPNTPVRHYTTQAVIKPVGVSTLNCEDCED
jgi:hypothetical protein